MSDPRPGAGSHNGTFGQRSPALMLPILSSRRRATRGVRPGRSAADREHLGDDGVGEQQAPEGWPSALEGEHRQHRQAETASWMSPAWVVTRMPGAAGSMRQPGAPAAGRAVDAPGHLVDELQPACRAEEREREERERDRPAGGRRDGPPVATQQEMKTSTPGNSLPTVTKPRGRPPAAYRRRSKRSIAPIAAAIAASWTARVRSGISQMATRSPRRCSV